MDELHGLRAQLANTLGSLGLPRSTAEAAGGKAAGVREMHQVIRISCISYLYIESENERESERAREGGS